MRIPADVATHAIGHGVGHAHFWDRAMVAGFSRAQFLRRGAATVGGVAGLGALGASPAFGAASDPKPVPANPDLFGFHLYLPGPGNEPSTITDFNGHVGVAVVRGTGAATGGDLNFEVDMRFMKGLYSGEDSRLRQGAFAFV
jgi:hypothetical protein